MENGAKDGELLKFKFRAKEDGIATFTVEGEFYSEAGQLIQTDFQEKQIQIGKEESLLQQQSQEEQGTDTQSTNASLKVLRLDQEGIVPQFEKDIFEYYITVSNNVKDIDVLAISENSESTIEITGNTNLKKGLNTINVQVTSPDKTQKKVYSIQVTKTANLESANTNLETLAIENALLTPPFSTSETNYKTEVSNQIESANILAIPENEKATVQISGKDDLKEGNNLVTILVTAPNGFTKRKYQIEIYKRNTDEENKYIEEQESQKEKVDEAYEIEELSVKTNEDSENNKDNENNQLKNKNTIIWIVVIVAIAIFVFAVTWYLKHKKEK